MVEPRTEAQDILDSNQLLRQWAAGLRTWSQVARDSSCAERRRTHELKDRSAILRPTAHVAATLDLIARRLSTSGGPDLPSMGEVRVSELYAVLVERHGFGVVDAARVLGHAVLCAGYPADAEDVSAADALGIIDWVLHPPI